MEIVNNLNPNQNHITKFKVLAREADELIMASPFLYSDFEDFFTTIEIDNINKITLITTIKNNFDELSNRVSSLISFYDYLTNRGKEFEIHIDNKLHGKIFLFKSGGNFFSGIISSANLTENGMIRNHEWGILIDEPKILQIVASDLYNCIEKRNISDTELIELMLRLDEYSAASSSETRGKISIDINDILSRNKLVFEDETKFFIKPIGVQNDPVLEGREFSHQFDRLHFSRRRPSAVDIGSILICYGVGTRKLLSYYRVLSDPIHTGDMDYRWPWYVEAENLSPNFGRIWWNYDLTIANVLENFHRLHPDQPITFNGGFTLGALNFGADKIRLTREFAEYLIGRITSS